MRARLALITIVVAACARTAAAQPPSPLEDVRSSFPGWNENATSATSAGVALADRWLGDRPFDNPAVAHAGFVEGSPLLLHLSRQDLRADNRRYDETAAFVDAAGAWGAVPAGPVTLVGYAFQPVLRREDNAYERGPRGGAVAPAVVLSEVTQREIRAGLGAACGAGRWRFGVAGEWTRRDDRTFYSETSGSPEEGERLLEFSGSAVGGQAGVRFDSDGESPRVSAGAALRVDGALSVDGTQQLDLAIGSTTTAVAAEREAGWEGGTSVRVRLTPEFHASAGLGYGSRRAWDGWDVEAGPCFRWSLGADYHDALLPWTVRAGGGMESLDGVPEARAGVVAIGFGWRAGQTTLDVGVVRRSMERSGHPTSFDDRVVGSVGWSFGAAAR